MPDIHHLRLDNIKEDRRERDERTKVVNVAGQGFCFTNCMETHLLQIWSLLLRVMLIFLEPLDMSN